MLALAVLDNEKSLCFLAPAGILLPDLHIIMKSYSNKCAFIILATVSLLAFSSGFSLTVFSADWPRWRGPKIDGICTETGLLKAIPESGLKLLWEFEGVGKGYSSVAIVGNKLYTMGDIADESGQNNQYLFCIDINTQKKLWQTKVGPPHQDGSRCTPTVDGSLVYAIGTDGDVVCVDASSGKEIWRVNFAKDFGGKMMSGWKYSESPLVDGDKVIVTPGAKDAIMVALDKKSGKLIWKCALPDFGNKGKDGAGYSSIVISEACGIRQYVQIIGRGCIGVSAKDGKFLCGYNKVANGVANIPTPVVDGDYVFCSTAYDTGSALLKLVSDGQGGVKAEEVYWLDKDTFQNHHGGFVKVGNYIYGGHGQNRGAPTCIEFNTGKIMWKVLEQPGKGSAAVLYADGNLIFRYDGGEVCLIAADPKAFKLNGKFTPPKKAGMGGPAWAHPVIVDSKLYLRHNNVIQCFDFKEK